MSQINPNLVQNTAVFTQYNDIDNFKLNNQGQVELKSGGEKALQKFKDFFSSWTSSGRLEITNRNYKLFTAISTMVSNERDLSVNFLKSTAPKETTASEGQKMIAGLNSDQEVHKALEQVHTKADALMNHINKNFHIPLEKVIDLKVSTGAISKEVGEQMKKVSKNGLQFSAQSLLDIQNEIKRFGTSTFQRLGTQREGEALLPEYGVYSVFMKDAKRGFLDTINGCKVETSKNDEYYADLIKDLPSESKTFLSLLVTQGGLIGTLSTAIATGETSPGNAIGIPSFPDYLASRLNATIASTKSSISTSPDGSLNISFKAKFDVVDNGIRGKIMRSQDLTANIVIPNPKVVDENGVPEIQVTNITISK